MSGNYMMISSSLSSLYHSVATFCDQMWWTIKTIIRPTPMSSLALVASFPFFLYAYDVAMLDFATSIKDDLDLTNNQLHIYLTCIGRAAYIIGAIVAGVATNYCGRKYLLASGGVIYIVGALIMVASIDNFVASSVGRALSGVGIGMGLLLGPIYIAETAPSTTRGYHGTFPQVMMAVGTIAVHVLELAIFWVPRRLAWRIIAGVVTLPTSFFTYIALSRRFSDTPCWLMMQGHVGVADQLMERCGATGTEPYDRREQLQHAAGFPIGYDPLRADEFPGRIVGFWAQLSDRPGPYFRDLFTATILLVAQEAACEQMFLVRFVPFVLLRNGLTSRLSLSMVGLGLACIKLFATMTSMQAVGQSMGGRRVLLLASIGIVGCFSGFLSGTSFADANECISRGTAFALYCFEISILEAAMATGLGPIPWMYCAEVFPLAVRAPSISLCLTLKFLISILLNMTLPLLYFSFERAWIAFLIAAGVIIVSFLVSYRFIRKITCRVLMDYAY